MKLDEQVDQIAKRLKEANRPFVVATVVRTEDATSAKAGAKALIDDEGEIAGWIGGGCAQPAVRKAALQAMNDGRTRLIRVRPGETDGELAGIEEYQAHCHSGGTLDIFIEPVLPQPSLLVLGASPVGRVLARLAREVGYKVTAVCSERDDAAPELASFVVVATQGRGDRAGLEAALAGDSTYVAFVASRRKAAKLKSELLESGVDPVKVEAIRAPAGIDIAAATPEEIAVSILAEMIQIRHAVMPQSPILETSVESDESVVTVEVVAQPSCGGSDSE